MLKKIYIVIASLPLVAFLGATAYLNSLEGWSGEFVARGILLPTIVISFVMTIFGIILMGFTVRKREPIRNLVFAIFLSSTPFLWFLIKWFG